MPVDSTDNVFHQDSSVSMRSYEILGGVQKLDIHEELCAIMSDMSLNIAIEEGRDIIRAIALHP